MLYGVDANKLPYSRFKRITTPVHPLVKSFIVVLWILSLFFFFYNKSSFLYLDFVTYSLPNIILFIIALSLTLAMPVVLISDIYKSSFGLSLKKLSLKNMEIERGDISEKSILNRHLDEIIYFFQATNYDVVVIEDLDRFGSPEIFVKLREINKVINDNEKTSGKIKFLYAIRDDIFVHKDRTKFFDFIIPVIPIINSSNSLDKMQERLKGEQFANKINTQFLREVSFYIDDLRLIHNIFNEFTIYYERLQSKNLDATKLLAMMVYKNMYPNDFEQLHHGEGALFKICKMKDGLLVKAKNLHKDELVELSKVLEAAKNERVRTVKGLVNLYIGHIITHHSQNRGVVGVVCNNNIVQVSQLTNFENFKPLLDQGNICLVCQGNNRVLINKSFSDIEAEINPGQTFLNRKQSIENKSDLKRSELQDKIHELKKTISLLSQKKLRELLVHNKVTFEALFKGNKISDGRLLGYLIKNGYLDENYHAYTSNFHAGRLTKNDRDFLLTIRNYNQPDPKQQIDTPKEVCKNMRPEDFEHKYVLNVTLVDYLLEQKHVNSTRVESAMQYLSRNFKDNEEFFTAYYDVGKNIEIFINVLSKIWPEFAVYSKKSTEAVDHISRILNYVDSSFIVEEMNLDGVLASFLSEQGCLVFTSEIWSNENYEILKSLNVKFLNLESINKNKELLDYAHEENLYMITPENVNYVIATFSNDSRLEKFSVESANYTIIMSYGSEYLQRYITENLQLYINSVFLALPENTEESSDYIKELVNNEIFEVDLREKILIKEQYAFDNIEDVPVELWECALSHEKIYASWKNLSLYLKNEETDNKIATEYLSRPSITDSLLKGKRKIKGLGDEDSKSLYRFIIENDELEDANYVTLIGCLPYWSRDFPDNISPEKKQYLARYRKIQLTEESFDFAKDDEQLLSILISSNIDKYLGDKDKYSITDSVRELLLAAEMSNEHKILISRDVTSSGVRTSVKLSQLIADILKRPKVDCTLYNDEVVSVAIKNARSIQDSVQILAKCIPNWDKNLIMQILGKLSPPYRDIASYGKRPKLPKTELNLRFARLLKQHEIISSITERKSEIKINTFTFG